MHHTLRRLCLLALPLAFAACEQVKSANPLSPQIAGPIAGVNVEAPAPVSPANGATIIDTQQPVTLVFLNPPTNSPRPMMLDIQIAVDAGFTQIAFRRDALPVGDNNQTSFRLPDRLASGNRYYWRARGEDGANVGTWSSAVFFNVVAPVILGAPIPRSPIGNERISSPAPELVVTNGSASGPYGALIYQFQIASEATFSAILTNAEVPAGGGETRYAAPAVPSFDKTFFWRARQFDPANLGPWSNIESFRAPSAPPPPPPPGGGGSSGGGGGPIDGNWQSCSAFTGDKGKLVECVHSVIRPGGDEFRAFEVTKRVAWLLRGEGAGLLIKNGGENVIAWKGYNFSLSRICYPDGHIYKVLSDAGPGGTNGPTWSDNDFVDRSLYVPAINPDSEPDPEPLPSLLVGLSMPRLAGQTSLYAAVPRRDWLFASLER
jgi:hypothetical protein